MQVSSPCSPPQRAIGCTPMTNPGPAPAGRGRAEGAPGVKAAKIGGSWTPRKLRHSFVSLLSANGVPIESIAQLVGHAGTAVTETVYRKELRPVFTDGAVVIGGVLACNKSPL